MKQIARLLIIAAAVASVPTVALGDDYEDFVKKAKESYGTFKTESEKKYADFRDKANREYEDFMRKPWKPVEVKPVIPTPPDPSPAPVVIPDNEPVVKPRPVVIDTVIVAPKIDPKPEPISPIREDVTPPKVLPTVNITLYGTPMSVRGLDMSQLYISGTSPSDFANAWRQLCNMPTNTLLRDCLDNRDKYQLCDWAYLKMLDAIAGKLISSPNERALLTGYMLNQTGYKTRYAVDPSGQLHVLYAVTGYIYGSNYYFLDNYCYYPLTKPSSNSVNICDFTFPKEKAIYMGLRESQKLNFTPAQTRTVNVYSYPGVTLSVTPNKNLIDFYNDMPDCTPSRERYSKWILYANTPASPELKRDLYPKLRQQIEGKTQAEAANFLIKVAESFPYGYDDKIWGYDRAFFPDETWNYPQSDCEDHAIHFSRLVRDLLGLDVALVYYPGHLASAVAFTDGSATGDYIVQNGKKWIVCDPTIFYANIGRTMTGKDNSTATLIFLDR